MPSHCEENTVTLTATAQVVATTVRTGLGDTLTDLPLGRAWKKHDLVNFTCVKTTATGTVKDLLSQVPIHAGVRLCPHLAGAVEDAAPNMLAALSQGDVVAVQKAALLLREAEHALLISAGGADLKVLRWLYSRWLKMGLLISQTNHGAEADVSQDVTAQIIAVATDVRDRLAAAGRTMGEEDLANRVATLGVRRHPKASLPAGVSLAQAKTAAAADRYERIAADHVAAVSIVGERARTSTPRRRDQLVLLDESEVASWVDVGRAAPVAWIGFCGQELARVPGRYGDLVAYRTPVWAMDAVAAENMHPAAVLAHTAPQDLPVYADGTLVAALTLWRNGGKSLTSQELPALLAAVR